MNFIRTILQANKTATGSIIQWYIRNQVVNNMKISSKNKIKRIIPAEEYIKRLELKNGARIDAFKKDTLNQIIYALEKGDSDVVEIYTGAVLQASKYYYDTEMGKIKEYVESCGYKMQYQKIDSYEKGDITIMSYKDSYFYVITIQV